MNVGINSRTRGWKLLSLLVAILWLAGCKVQTQGLVELRDANGEPYSFAGATVSLFPLNAATVMPVQSGTPLATATLPPEGEPVMLAVPRISLWASRFYLMEFRCPADAPDDACNVSTPLHVVLSGAALRAGGWRATALTEAAFHSAVYGVIAGFTSDEIQKTLDDTAAVLLAGTYEDLLAWNPTDTSALRRPGTLTLLSTALADGIANNNLKSLVQQWVSMSQVGTVSMDFALTRQLIVAGSYAYRARSDGLDIVDVHDPQHPAQVSQVDFDNATWLGNAVVQEGYVYLTHRANLGSPSVLRIIDVRDPLHPALAKQIQLPREARFMVAAGDYLYVGESYSSPSWSHGVTVLDIRDPQNAVQVASLPLMSISDQAVLFGQYLLVGDYNGITIVDVSHPLTPVVAGQWAGMPIYGAMALAGDKIYVAGTRNDVVVLDVSNPLAPTPLATLTFDWLENLEYAGAVSTLYPVGSDLYVGLPGGIHRIDISDPAAPKWTGAIDSAYAGSIAIDQEQLYVLGSALDGLSILSLDALQHVPVLAGSLDLPGGASAATAATTRAAYSPAGDYGVHIIDLRRPRAPAWVTTDKRFARVFKVAFADTTAYFGDYYSFYTLDIANPLAPVELPGSIPWQDRGYRNASGVEIVGDYAYVSVMLEDNFGYETRLVVLDLQNPQVPVLTNQVLLPMFSGLIAAAGNKAYLTTYVDVPFLDIFDIQNPVAPEKVSSLELSVEPHSAAAAGDYLYMACGNAGLIVVDASDPVHPSVVNTVATAGFVSAITLIDGYALVTDSVGGILLLDLANPAAPEIIGNAVVRGNARNAFVQNRLMYVATSFGLDVLKLPVMLRD